MFSRGLKQMEVVVINGKPKGSLAFEGAGPCHAQI